MKNKSEELNEVLTAYQLMTQIEKDRSVKNVVYNVHYRQDVCLYDLSLNASGQDEDKFYAFNKWYRSHIRRGNTVIQTFDKNDKVLSTLYGRRGFEKFFDLMYEYIQYNLNEIKDLDNFGIKESDEHYELCDIIFSKVRKAIQNKKKICVYKMVKANGENAQIAWINSLNTWLIASKNVSLLARDEKDLDEYKEERFHFALLIAKEWFRLIDQIQRENQIQNLKDYMAGKTFIGEYCGNQNYQHLVKYQEIDIHFTAIVENESQCTCIAPEEAFNIFKKFKLTHVAYQNLGTFDNWNSLNQTLKTAYKNVAKASIESEEEGSVIYLVEIDEKGINQTLSLSKLKTLEYRIYRKLREKLRGFISQKGNKYRPWKEFMDRFKTETYQLCRDNSPPYPLEFYFFIAKKAFEFGEKYYKESYLIHDQYITFLSLLLYQISLNEELTPDCFKKETIQKAMSIKWSEFYNSYKNQKSTEQVLEEGKNKAIQGERITYVFVPIGIPGMGKSYLIKSLQGIAEARNGHFSKISSDGIRLECMERLAKTKRYLTKEELFDKTAREARDLFNERLANLVSSKNISSKAHFIFIDKNHPPNAIRSTLDSLRMYSDGGNLKIIAVTPVILENPFSYEDGGKCHRYPFSIQFFLNCLDRVQKRKEHETLPGSGIKSASVLLMFLNFFRNVNLNKASILRNGFDGILPIPFTAESDQLPISPELLETLTKVLQASKPGEMCQDEFLVSSFLNSFEKSGLQFKFPNSLVVENSIHKFFDDEIQNFAEISQIQQNTQNIQEQSIISVKIDTNQEESKLQEEKNIKTKLNPNLAVYNPKKIPLYLGLFTDNSIDLIRNYVLDGLKELTTDFSLEHGLNDCYEDIKKDTLKRL